MNYTWLEPIIGHYFALLTINPFNYYFASHKETQKENEKAIILTKCTVFFEEYTVLQYVNKFSVNVKQFRVYDSDTEHCKGSGTINIIPEVISFHLHRHPHTVVIPGTEQNL